MTTDEDNSTVTQEVPQPQPVAAAGPAGPDGHLPEPSVEEKLPEAARHELQRVSERVEEMMRQMAEANRIGQDRERIIDRLHDENQKLRAGELQQMLSPILRDLIRLFDDLQRTAQAYATRGDAMPAEAVRDLECYRDAVSDILYRQGVERYEASEGATFDPKEHRALSSVVTTDPGKDRTIAQVVRVGFRTDARVIRHLEAEVYRFKENAGGDQGLSQLATNPKGG